MKTDLLYVVFGVLITRMHGFELDVLYFQVNQNACYAPPLVYGRVCTSSTSIFGHKGYRVTYSISVTGDAGTLVCCQGYQAATRSFRAIGCGYESFSGSVSWGNVIDTPKIKCKGTPFGAFLRWGP